MVVEASEAFYGEIIASVVRTRDSRFMTGRTVTNPDINADNKRCFCVIVMKVSAAVFILEAV